MGFPRRVASLAATALVLSSAASAQAGGSEFPIRLSLTPYLGLLIPTRELLEYQNQKTKLSIMVTWGGRLGLQIRQRVSLDAGVAYSPGTLVFTEDGADVNESVRVLSGSGRLTLFLLRRNEPFWMGVSGGVGVVRHIFHQAGFTDSSSIKPGTRLGAVVGLSMGIRLGRVIALNIGAEDHLYRATFDVNGVMTSRKQQHDIRFVGGIHIPFLGF